MVDNVVPAISVEELKQRLDQQEKILVLDVREPFEFQQANIGGLLIPLGELQDRLDAIDREQEIAVLCHHGNRSARAVQLMLRAGFRNVKNITGGIDSWAQRVDPGIRRY
jgi:rhodanese-related sulfurtransferase